MAFRLFKTGQYLAGPASPVALGFRPVAPINSRRSRACDLRLRCRLRLAGTGPTRHPKETPKMSGENYNVIRGESGVPIK